MFKKSLYQSAYAVAVLLVTAGHADAADGWKVRFPLSGSLGGEIAAKQLTPGLYAASRASSNPNPDAAPVMTATLPTKFFITRPPFS